MESILIAPNDEKLLNCSLRAAITKVSRQVWKSGESYLGYTNHPRPDSGLVLICSDIEMHYSLDGYDFCAHRGDAVYIPAGLQYRVTFHGSTPNTHPDSYTINFHLTDAQGRQILLGNGPLLLAGDPQNHRYAPLAAELYEAFCVNRISHSCNTLKQEAIFLYLLDRILTDARSHTDIRYPIRRGVRTLTDEWNKNEPIGKYAALCGLSESYFYALFKQSIGVSPVEYRNRIRIDTARHLLESTTLSIEEIALSVGFDTPFYFSRVFRQLTTLSPRAWRERALS